MAISKDKLKVIKNNHLEETEMLLHKLLRKADMSQAEFAKKVQKDASTINRWIKNNRAISWDNAEKIAKVLNIHPTEVYQPTQDIILKYKCTWDCVLQPMDVLNKIRIPYEYYHDDIRAVLMDCPGTSSDGEIWLFDMPKNKLFAKDAIGKICYLKASKSFKDKLGNKSAECKDVVALLNPKGNGTFDILHNYTREPINDLCKNLIPTDFEIASPVKVKYDPHLLQNINK
jgi:transcriptional regulator with XRE-family HTH domain